MTASRAGDLAVCPAGSPAAHGRLRCRRCQEPVTVQGDPRWGKAAHTRTGQELGSDGHLAAPIDADLVSAAMARRAGERS
jgi:hypothetical protein